METPPQALHRSKHRRNIPSSSSTTPKSAISSSFSKQNVFLQDWWLIKAGPDSEGRRLGVGGSASNENQGIRIFLSAPIVKRNDAVTLMTVDGKTIMVNGPLNRSRTLLNGFSHEMCNHFVIGFPYYWDEFAAPNPYYWDEFAALAVDDEPGHVSVSSGFFGSDVYITPPISDERSSRDIFDNIMKQNSGYSTAKKESAPQPKIAVSSPDEAPLHLKKIKAESKRRGCSNAEVVERNGPLTRSRSQLYRTRSRQIR